MPRDGALTLSDVRSPTLAIVCEPGGRRGRYRLDRLMAEQGDAMLPRTLSCLDVYGPRPIATGLAKAGTEVTTADVYPAS
jgi:hypothetical protein